MFPPEKEDWERAAMIAHIVYRMGGGKRYKHHDFMPKFDDSRVTDIADQISMFESMSGEGNDA